MDTNGTEANLKLRDEIRGKILGIGKEFKRARTKLFGVEVEFKEPSVEEMQLMSERSLKAEEDVKNGVASSDSIEIYARRNALCMQIIRCCVVPGTDVHVFEEADLPDMLKWPYSGGILEANAIIFKFSNVDILVKESKGNSLATQSATP